MRKRYIQHKWDRRMLVLDAADVFFLSLLFGWRCVLVAKGWSMVRVGTVGLDLGGERRWSFSACSAYMIIETNFHTLFLICCTMHMEEQSLLPDTLPVSRRTVAMALKTLASCLCTGEAVRELKLIVSLRNLSCCWQKWYGITCLIERKMKFYKFPWNLLTLRYVHRGKKKFNYSAKYWRREGNTFSS